MQATLPEVKQPTSALWSCYLSDTIQATAEQCFIPKKPMRILEFMRDAPVGQNPPALEVIQPLESNEVGFIFRGRCADDEGEFTAYLQAQYLEQDCRKWVINQIRRHYPATSGDDWGMIVKAARFMGVTP